MRLSLPFLPFLPVAAAAILASGCDKAPPAAPPQTGGGAAAAGAAVTTAAAPTAPTAPPTEALPLADLPPRLRALGTEPFWAVQIEPGQATYTTPEDQDGEPLKIRREATPHGAVLIGRRNDANFVLAIARRQCSDGMSDRIYRWRAVLKHDGQTLEGCAETPERLNAAPAP